MGVFALWPLLWGDSCCAGEISQNFCCIASVLQTVLRLRLFFSNILSVCCCGIIERPQKRHGMGSRAAPARGTGKILKETPQKSSLRWMTVAARAETNTEGRPLPPCLWVDPAWCLSPCRHLSGQLTHFLSVQGWAAVRSATVRTTGSRNKGARGPQGRALAPLGSIVLIPTWSPSSSCLGACPPPRPAVH